MVIFYISIGISVAGNSDYVGYIEMSLTKDQYDIPCMGVSTSITRFISFFYSLVYSMH